MVQRKLSIPLKERKEKKREASEETLLLEQKKRGQRERMEKPRSNTTQRTFIHHTHAHDQVLRWHDLSKTRFLILQNKWGRYATLSLPRATQKPIKKVGEVSEFTLVRLKYKRETKSELKEMRACLLFWKSCKNSKYREKEKNHVLHQVVLRINIQRWRC